MKPEPVSLLMRFLDATDVMLVYLDRDFNLLAVNAAYAETCRMRPQDMIGRNHFELYPDAENEAIFRRVRDTGESVFYKDKPFEFPDQPERGVTYWDWSLSPVRSAAGQVTGLVFSLRETTEYTQVELALRESEERFRVIASNTPDHILVQDRELRYSYVLNPQLGLTEQDMIGKTDHDFLSKEDADTLTRIKREVLETGRAARVEVPLISRKGEQEYFEGSYVPKYSADGQVDGLIGYFRNATERKRAEESLRLANERLEMAQRAAKAGSWDWDVTTGRIEWTWELFEIFGLAPKETAASFDAWRAVIHPEDLQAASERIDRAIKDHTPLDSEYRIVLPDGQVRWINALGHTLYDESGRPVRMTGICLDISERKRAEEALRKSEEHYRSLFENMLNGFAYCRMLFEQGRPQDFIYLNVNRAFETLTGLRNVVGKKVSEVIPGIRESDPELFDIYGRVALTGVPERFETYVSALDMWFSISVYSPMREHFVAVFDVITERKRAETALAHSHSLMRYIIEHNRSAIAVHDRDLKYVYVSQRYLDDYKVKERDVIGKHHYDVFPDLPQKWRDVHQKALAGEISSAEDDPYVREDGTVDWTRWECRPWYEADGSIGGIIIYTEVITERKKAENTLREHLDELQRWHRVTLGRERRVQELKSEVNQLLERLSEPARYLSPESQDPAGIAGSGADKPGGGSCDGETRHS